MIALKKLRLKYKKTIYSLMGLTKVIQNGYDMVRVQNKDRLLYMIEDMMKKKKLIVVRAIN